MYKNFYGSIASSAGFASGDASMVFSPARPLVCTEMRGRWRCGAFTGALVNSAALGCAAIPLLRAAVGAAAAMASF